MELNEVLLCASLLTYNTEVYSVFHNYNMLSYIIRGELRHFNDNDEFIAKAGDLIYTSKYANYKAQRKLDKVSNDFESIVLLFSEDFKSSIEISDKSAAHNFKVNSDTLITSLLEVRQRILNKNKYTSKEVDCLTTIVQSELSKIASQQLCALVPHCNDKFLSFIYEHITINITVNQLAAKYGKSTSTFQRLFKNKLGVSPHKWLKDKRLDFARLQMLLTQKPISEIYLDLGFEDLAHFSKEFKKKFGYNPSATYNTAKVNYTSN